MIEMRTNLRTAAEQLPRIRSSSLILGVTLGSQALAGTLQEGLDNLENAQGYNATQQNIANVVAIACPKGTNGADFQQRCTELIGTASDDNNAEVTGAVSQVSPEQVGAQSNQATKVSGGQLNMIDSTIADRLALVRAGGGGLSNGLVFAINGKPATGDLAYKGFARGGAAGDDAGGDLGAGFDRFGVFLNVIYVTGDVDDTFQVQTSYDHDTWGFTAGADYRLTDNLILGAAFTYLNTDVDFDNNRGSTDIDSYNGSLYGSYHFSSHFFVDGIASYGKIDYDNERRLRYTTAASDLILPDGTVAMIPKANINSKAKADVDGDQYSFAFGGGYEFSRDALSITPYARGSYTKLSVDAYDEKGGDGWGLHVRTQNDSSLQSILGTQLAYNVNTSWGVLLPQLRGEWHHEFKDDAPTPTARFLGDTTSGLSYQVLTSEPDTDYFKLGAGVSGTLPHGIAAFIDYEALIGYDDVTSHQFTVGLRKEF